jgi:hypothetical protein
MFFTEADISIVAEKLNSIAARGMYYISEQISSQKKNDRRKVAKSCDIY